VSLAFLNNQPNKANITPLINIQPYLIMAANIPVVSTTFPYLSEIEFVVIDLRYTIRIA
jgi:hypothetical protein